MWVYSHTVISTSPTGIFQFNSGGYNHRGWLQILRTQLHKTATASDASHKSQVVTSTSEQSTINQGFFLIPPWIQFIFSGKTHIYVYRLLQGHERTARWNAHKSGLEGSQAQNFLSSWICGAPSSSTWMCLPTLEALPHPVFWDFYGGFIMYA